MATESLWNQRDLGPPPVCTHPWNNSQENKEILKTLTGSLTEMVTVFGDQSDLEKETYVLHRLVYKHQNAFRADKKLKGLKRIKQCLTRWKEMHIVRSAEVLKDCVTSESGGLLYLPSSPMMEYLLMRMLGAAHLLQQLLKFCAATHVHVMQNLKLGFYVPDMLVFAAVISRVWVIGRSHLLHLVTLYDRLVPVLDELQETEVQWLPRGMELPQTLQEFVLHIDKDESINKEHLNTPVTPVAPSGRSRKNIAITMETEDAGVAVRREESPISRDAAEDTGVAIKRMHKPETSPTFQQQRLLPDVQAPGTLELEEEIRSSRSFVRLREIMNKHQGQFRAPLQAKIQKIGKKYKASPSKKVRLKLLEKSRQLLLSGLKKKTEALEESSCTVPMSIYEKANRMQEESVNRTAETSFDAIETQTLDVKYAKDTHSDTDDVNTKCDDIDSIFSTLLNNADQSVSHEKIDTSQDELHATETEQHDEFGEDTSPHIRGDIREETRLHFEKSDQPWKIPTKHTIETYVDHHLSTLKLGKKLKKKVLGCEQTLSYHGHCLHLSKKEFKALKEAVKNAVLILKSSHKNQDGRKILIRCLNKLIKKYL